MFFHTQTLASEKSDAVEKRLLEKLLRAKVNRIIFGRMATTNSCSVYILIIVQVFTLNIGLCTALQDEAPFKLALSSSNNDLEGSASSLSLSTNSHQIVATGWPSTSQMWPSLHRADESTAEDTAKGRMPELLEPFIYADKPRSGDYSLLLALNQTVLTIIKSHLKPMTVNLSFEYYFNYDQKITAPPGIKIEVDRKQFKYIEPSSESVKLRFWTKFNEALTISDPSQFDNHDWLKFSLIIRQPLSLVAIRHLKVEFRMDTSENLVNTPISALPTVAPVTSAPPALVPVEASSTAPILPQPEQPSSLPSPLPLPNSNFPPLLLSPTPEITQGSDEPVPDASDSISSTVKPAKKSFPWNVVGRRRKREAVSPASNNNVTLLDLIVLTCYQRDQCDWRTDLSGDNQIQWSLARMPPSTRTVHSGYYYVSNMNNYGNIESPLLITLNQTDSATIADQNSDHCIELALYITERSHLSMYQYSKSADQWSRGNLLIKWSPTVIATRKGLPGTKLPSMEESGWTYETLCFADFFIDNKKCGLGLCAFAFEMAIDAKSSTELQIDLQSPQTIVSEQPELGSEQVIGVSLLREFALNVPSKVSPIKWLETWQREEVEPTDNWKFYPKLDLKVEGNNITLMNQYDSAHYYIQSDWISFESNQELTGSLAIDLHGTDQNATNTSANLNGQINDQSSIFTLKVTTNLVDSNFHIITKDSSLVEWSTQSNSSSLYNLSLPISKKLEHENQQLNLFKVILEISLETHWLSPSTNGSRFIFSIANVSLSDRCFPNPCEHGICLQNGTGYDNWNCTCEDRYRGRHCEFARWCNIPHIAPWYGSAGLDEGKSGGLQQVTSKTSNQQLLRQTTRVSGKEYCLKKLGSGSRCTEIDLALTDTLFTEEEKTFICSCQDDYYLSDDSKCKQAHLCNSVLCPSIGMFCDESKPFNRTQPCHCNEKQDWFPNLQDSNNKCIRRQCHDKQHDCDFDAHICLPTLPGEKPICKCGPKFTLKVEASGRKFCQSTACVLPTLNECQQVCIADNSNLERPYKCNCHPGYTLNANGYTCDAQRPHMPPHCKPSCNPDTQICTDAGCKCKQGFVEEGRRCLNVCELTYAENKQEFELIESVCPLGLCHKSTFQCQCSDPSSSTLINSKYEPIYANNSDGELPKQRISPLCHLRRVCQHESSSFKICQSQGAICVPDYTKPAMFDCICPPSTDKKLLGQGTSSEFVCEPKCESRKNECLRRQGICKLIDKDAVRCDCLPGLMFNKHDQKCYLAKYSYAFNLIIVNRYYEHQSQFYKTGPLNKTESVQLLESFKDSTNGNSDRLDQSNLNLILPQYIQQNPTVKSTFITDYNRCNITQVIPATVIEDPYEHNIESFLSYIEQCNEKIHQNVKTYHLNSKLGEDLRQSLRQHLREFTVTTSNSSCIELEGVSPGMFLNCTIFLQSNEPIPKPVVEYVLSDCDKNTFTDEYCWIKPRLLLRKPLLPNQVSTKRSELTNETQNFLSDLNYRQIIPCELDNFCGLDAVSVRADDKTSLCSCKCPPEIEVVDIKDLEPRKHDDDLSKILVKEICAPKNHCGANSTFCLGKIGSVCHYDIRKGSLCSCVYPSYEDNEGRCVEVTFSQLNSTLIVIIVMLGVGLIVSIAINLAVVAKSKSFLGRSKQYPLNEYPPARTNNRSTGVPNPAFSND